MPGVTEYRRDAIGELHLMSGSDETLCGLVGFDGHPVTPGEPEPPFDLCPDCEAADARLYPMEGRPAVGDKPTCGQCGSENLARRYVDATAFGSGSRERIPGMLVCLDCEGRAARGEPPFARPIHV
jgi:hypothetical protein